MDEIQKALAAEVERLQGLLPHAAECAALADLHILCADAGIAPGHIVERVRALVERLAAARVAVVEWHGSDHDELCWATAKDPLTAARFGCTCGSDDNNRNRSAARLALGLEAKP